MKGTAMRIHVAVLLFGYLVSCSTRALPTTSVTDPAYRSSGALQMLDYLRWGARKALRHKDGLPATIHPLFSTAAAIAETESGHARLEVLPTEPLIPADLEEVPLGGITVRIHGPDPGSDYMLVRSLDGLRCVLDGMPRRRRLRRAVAGHPLRVRLDRPVRARRLQPPPLRAAGT